MSVFEDSSDEPEMLPPLPYSAGAGFVGDGEGAAVQTLQEVGAVEGRHADLGEIDVAAVGVGADDAALVADRDALQLAGGEAVLVELVDLDVAVGVGELGQTAGTEMSW